jgi:hypothetical protein
MRRVNGAMEGQVFKKSVSRHGRSVRRLCNWLLAGAPTAVVVYWLSSDGRTLGAEWISDPAFHAEISLHQRVAAAIVSLVALIPALWAVVRAKCLAGIFERQEHFTLLGVRSAVALPRSLFWFGGGQSLAQTLIPLALTAGNATGQRILAFSLDWGAVMAIALGVIVTLFARALDHGRVLAEDLALTI